MRQYVTFILLLLTLGAVGYYYRAPIRIAMKQIYTQSRPCVSPVTYRIASIDPKFNLSSEEARTAIESAANIWEKDSSRDLFAYDPSGTVAISFIYDYRQAAIDKLKPLGISIEVTQTSYDSLRARYDALKSQYGVRMAALEPQIAAFNSAQSAYNDEVTKWNAQGGAPQSVYRQLEKQRAALVSEKNSINDAQWQLNATADTINALAVQLNRLARELNIKAETYNEIGRSTGGEFEEGLYERSFGEEKITIYEFGDRQELVRVLAHELGHALGLEHVDDKNAIMYYLNHGTSERMSAADFHALEEMCGAIR